MIQSSLLSILDVRDIADAFFVLDQVVLEAVEGVSFLRETK